MVGPQSEPAMAARIEKFYSAIAAKVEFLAMSALTWHMFNDESWSLTVD